MAAYLRLKQRSVFHQEEKLFVIIFVGFDEFSFL